MKTISFNIPLLLLIIFSSCQHDTSTEKIKHASFTKIEDFFQTEKGIKRFNIVNINVDDFHHTEYNNINLGTRRLEASYVFTLSGNNKNYESKAELISTDSINWRIRKVVIMEEADSAEKHYKKTMEWEYPDSLENYDVYLEIHDY